MSDNHKDTPESYPTLGRWMSWVDRPGSGRKIFWIIALFCAASFALEWAYVKKAYFDIESVKGFYAYFAFILFIAMVFAASFLRLIVKVRQDFYGSKSVDGEDYPEDQIQRIDHNA